MHHEVHVVEQHPLRLLVALHVGGALADLRQPEFHFVGNGLDLPWIATAGDDEVVGEAAGDDAHVQHGGGFSFLGFAGGEGEGDLASDVVLSHQWCTPVGR